MIIRKSTDADLDQISFLHEQAFNEEDVAELVRNLLTDQSAMPLLSLAAELDTQIVGHVLFTKASLTSNERVVNSVILAPLAVIPRKQKQGIGGKLIQEGLRILTKTGTELVFVLGHPEYYPKHGFKPAGALGFEAPYPIEEKNAAAWMVQELCPGIIGSVHGNVLCADAMNRPEYWRE